MYVDGSGRVWAMRPDPAGIAAAAQLRVAAREKQSPLAGMAGEQLEGSDFARLVDGVAVIPMRGALMNRINWAFWSYEEIARDIQLAMGNARAEAILLDIDSPGGLVAGCSDLAAMIQSVREIKPLHAHANGMCASAAYMLGASASRLHLASGCMIGSVGTVIEYLDLEPYFEALGARMVRVVAEQSPNKRLDPESDSGRAEMQALVDAGAEEFLNMLASGRGLSRDEVFQRFGQGLVFEPSEAIRRGMADGMATHDDILAELAGREISSSAGSAAAGKERLMDWASITAAALREHRPDLVEAIEADARAGVDVEGAADTARAAGAEAERARILGIEEVAVAGHEDLVAAAKADGKTTAEQVAVQIITAQKAAGAGYLAARTEAEAAVGQVPAAPTGATVPRSGSQPATDEDARAAWTASAELQAEFRDVEDYVAFARAEQRQKVILLRKAN